MKSISLWASTHILGARVLITLCHLAIWFLCIGLGLRLFIKDIHISSPVLIVMGHCFIFSYLLFTSRKSKLHWFKQSYAKQKPIAFFMLLLGYALLICSVNQTAQKLTRSIQDQHALSARFIVHTDPSSHHAQQYASKKSPLNDFLKANKKQIKSQLIALKNHYKAQHNKKAAALVQVLLVLLAIGLTVFLGIIIAFLGCSVSCSGSPVLGVAIWIVGWGGLVWLFIASIKKITTS